MLGFAISAGKLGRACFYGMIGREAIKASISCHQDFFSLVYVVDDRAYSA